MSTSSLPDRLRALADFIDSHNLPEPNIGISHADYGTLHLASHDEVCAWAEVLGRDVRVQLVAGRDDEPPFTAYAVDNVRIGEQRFSTVVFYDHTAPVPA